MLDVLDMPIPGIPFICWPTGTLPPITFPPPCLVPLPPPLPTTPPPHHAILILRLSGIPLPPAPPHVYHWRNAEIRVVEVLGRDFKCGELENGGGRAETAALNVGMLVVSEVLGHAGDDEGESLVE
jgi:hypothetical protein